MMELFRIKNKNSMTMHAPMAHDKMSQELMGSPLSSEEILEESKDGGKTWNMIGRQLPERKIALKRKKDFSRIL